MLSIVKVPPPKSSTRSLFSAGPPGDLGDCLVEPVDRELVGVADHRHDQPVVDRNRDADVDPALGQQAGIGPVGVERRVAPERLDGRLDDERDVAQGEAVGGLVFALELVAKPHQARGVDLHLDVGVRDRQRPGHLGGDALAHLGHRHEDFVGTIREADLAGGACRGCACRPAACRRRRSTRGRPRRWWRLRVAAGAPLTGRRRGSGAADDLAADRGARALGLDVVRDVVASDPAAATRAHDHRRGQAVLAKEAADGRRHPGVGVARQRTVIDRGDRGGRGGRSGRGRRRRAARAARRSRQDRSPGPRTERAAGAVVTARRRRRRRLSDWLGRPLLRRLRRPSR